MTETKRPDPTGAASVHATSPLDTAAIERAVDALGEQYPRTVLVVVHVTEIRPAGSRLPHVNVGIVSNGTEEIVRGALRNAVALANGPEPLASLRRTTLQ